MTDKQNVLQTEASAALEEAASEFFEQIDQAQQEQEQKQEAVNQEEIQEDTAEEAEVTEELQEEDKNITDDSEDSEESEADEETQEEEEGKSEDDKSLSGFNQEFRDAVDRIQDPELKNQIIEAGKKQRASIDRKHRELGEGKKLVDRVNNAFSKNSLPYTEQQYTDVLERYIAFDAMFTQDPKSAVELLAQSAGIELNNLNNKPVQKSESSNDLDVDDYKTPEEIALEKRLEVLEERESQREQDLVKQQERSYQQQVMDFMNAKDDSGNLKHPHFDKVKQDMALLVTNGMSLEQAYNKAIRLDDELSSEREKQLLKKAEQKRKAEVEKAKRLRRQTPRSSNLNSQVTDPKALLLDAVDKLGFA